MDVQPFTFIGCDYAGGFALFAPAVAIWDRAAAGIL